MMPLPLSNRCHGAPVRTPSATISQSPCSTSPRCANAGRVRHCFKHRRAHLCSATSRNHGASANAANAHAATVEIEEAEAHIVENVAVLEGLERSFTLSSFDATSTLISEVEQMTLDTRAYLAELSDLPAILEEVQHLGEALQVSSAPSRSRSERGELRAAKRASRKAPAPAAKTRQQSKPRAKKIARTEAIAEAETTVAVVDEGSLPGRQFSEASTSGAAPLHGGKCSAVTRSSRNKKWGHAARKPHRPSMNRSIASDGMGVLLRNTAHAKLLSAADETTLMLRVEPFLKLEIKFEALGAALAREPTMAEFAASLGSQVDPVELQAAFEQGALCKQAMVQANIRLVVAIAQKYNHRGVPMADLVSEGMNGLVRAVEKFDVHKGFKFSTYAHWWVRQAIGKSVTDQSRVIRIPQNLVSLASSVMKLKAEMTELHQREPTPAELASAAGITPKKLDTLLLAYRPAVSLNAPIGDDNTLEDLIEDETAPPVDDEMRHDSLRQDMESVLLQLPEREAAVLRMRYGLVTGHPATLEEIGVRFHLTRERIRQLEHKALRKLRMSSTHSETIEVYKDAEETFRSLLR